MAVLQPPLGDCFHPFFSNFHLSFFPSLSVLLFFFLQVCFYYIFDLTWSSLGNYLFGVTIMAGLGLELRALISVLPALVEVMIAFWPQYTTKPPYHLCLSFGRPPGSQLSIDLLAS